MNNYFEKYNFFNDFEDIDEFQEDNNNEYIIYFISGFILGAILSFKLL